MEIKKGCGEATAFWVGGWDKIYSKNGGKKKDGGGEKKKGGGKPTAFGGGGGGTKYIQNNLTH